jgi:hypothetical protein
MRSILALTVLAALGTRAGAECRQEDDTAPVKAKIQVIDGKRVIVIDKEIIICGHPPRPAVAYLTAPKTIDYSWENLEKSLVPLILQSVTNGGVR